MTTYAAAPRGRKFFTVIDDNDILWAVWEGDVIDDTKLYDNFRDALEDAVEMSFDSTTAFEVVAFDDNEELIGYARIVATSGVLYGMLESDDLDEAAAKYVGTIDE